MEDMTFVFFEDSIFSNFRSALRARCRRLQKSVNCKSMSSKRSKQRWHNNVSQENNVQLKERELKTTKRIKQTFSGERIPVPGDAIAHRLLWVGGGECRSPKTGLKIQKQNDNQVCDVILIVPRFRACEAQRLSLRGQNTRSDICRRKLKFSTHRLASLFVGDLLGWGPSISWSLSWWSSSWWSCPGWGADEPEEDRWKAAGGGAWVLAGWAWAEVHHHHHHLLLHLLLHCALHNDVNGDVDDYDAKHLKEALAKLDHMSSWMLSWP